MRSAYRWHDGCSSELSIFVGGCQWCSLETMVEHWKEKISFCNADRKENPDNYPSYTPSWDSMKVKPVWWKKQWIPIGTSNTVSSIYVDLDPAPAGAAGQIISDAGIQDAQVMAPSLGSFFRSLAKHLEGGRLAERPHGTWGEVKPRLPVWWSQFDWSL